MFRYLLLVSVLGGGFAIGAGVSEVMGADEVSYGEIAPIQYSSSAALAPGVGGGSCGG